MTTPTPDPDTLSSFYEQWEPRLFRSIRLRVPDTQTAQDIAQEVWIVLCHRVGDGIPPANLAQLMFGIASHKIADWFRSRIPQPDRPDAEPDLPDPASGPGESAVDKLPDRMVAAYYELERVLPRLTSRQRDAVLYRYYVGMSVAEVAEAMGVKVDAAKRFLAVGMRKIRNLLAQAGYQISVSTKEMP